MIYCRRVNPLFKGIIISTNPGEGTKQKVGTSIEIVYSAGVGDINPVADVKGYIPKEDAEWQWKQYITKQICMNYGQATEEGKNTSSGYTDLLDTEKGMAQLKDSINLSNFSDQHNNIDEFASHLFGGELSKLRKPPQPCFFLCAKNADMPQHLAIIKYISSTKSICFRTVHSTHCLKP